MTPARPCKSYVEISFTSPDSQLSYIIFQNFYAQSVSVKQFISMHGAGTGKDEKKIDANWVTVLKNYRLMRNAHFETDAQNWHIIGTELLNAKFDRRNLRYLRLYMKQPSPSWLDFTLKNIQCFAKKFEAPFKLETKALSPFEEMKSRLRDNLKGMKKGEDSEEGLQSYDNALSPSDEIRKIDFLHY